MLGPGAMGGCTVRGTFVGVVGPGVAGKIAAGGTLVWVVVPGVDGADVTERVFVGGPVV